MNRLRYFAALLVVAATCSCDKPPPVHAPEEIDYSLVCRDELAKLPDGTNIVFPVADGNYPGERTYGLIDGSGTVLIRPYFRHVSQTSAGRLPRPYGYWCGQEGALLHFYDTWLYVGKYESRAMKPLIDGNYSLNLGDSLFIIGDHVLNNRSPTDAQGFIPAFCSYQLSERLPRFSWLAQGCGALTGDCGFSYWPAFLASSWATTCFS